MKGEAGARGGVRRTRTRHHLQPSDADLQRRVTAALARAVGGHAAYIGVAAHDGEVTLSGVVATHAVRLVAAATAAEVWGVQLLADDIDIEGHDRNRTNVSSLPNTD